MHRFFLTPEACGGERLVLTESDSHHAVRVLRLQPGDPLEVLDGAGRVFSGRVLEAGKRGVSAAVTAIRTVPAPPRVILAVSVIKGRAMDFLVQKATELGVSEIVPLLAGRGVVRIPAAEADDKLAGWIVTAKEACKQCGNPWLPRFHSPLGWPAWLAGRGQGPLLVAALSGQPRLPGEVLRDHAGPPSAVTAPAPVTVTVAIGPEGDFTPEELSALEQAGAVPITLGPLVLRAETAAIAALAVVQHELRMLIRSVGGSSDRAEAGF